MALQSRSFQTDKDVAEMRQLISDCWQIHGPAVTFHVGDLHWRLKPQVGQSPEQAIWLWHEKGKLRAFAWFDAPDSGDLLCHPDVDRNVVEPVLLEWLEDEARLQGATHFTVGAFESDGVREGILTDRGYQKQSSFLHHMQKQLDVPVVAAETRDGYSVGTTAATDLLSLSTAIACAFQSEPKPVSTYEALRAGRFYQNDLDIVIKSENGEVVAFCTAWLDEKNKVGLLEPVGCHPDHQRLGLASVAVSTALKALRIAGAHSAVVYPIGDSAASVLYKRCGFTAVANDYDWTMKL